ncbi:hypothetical protein D3C80_1261550 [compost metagenome]
MFGASRPFWVTMPWRSWSGSQAKATSKRSRRPIRPCMAYGEDGSMRICPSQSTHMKRKVGSTSVLTTSRFSL